LNFFETIFSMFERLLDSFLRAMSWPSQHRKISLKVLALNFMLIAAAAQVFIRAYLHPVLRFP